MIVPFKHAPTCTKSPEQKSELAHIWKKKKKKVQNTWMDISYRKMFKFPTRVVNVEEYTCINILNSFHESWKPYWVKMDRSMLSPVTNIRKQAFRLSEHLTWRLSESARVQEERRILWTRERPAGYSSCTINDLATGTPWSLSIQDTQVNHTNGNILKSVWCHS